MKKKKVVFNVGEKVIWTIGSHKGIAIIKHRYPDNYYKVEIIKSLSKATDTLKLPFVYECGNNAITEISSKRNFIAIQAKNKPEVEDV